MLPLFLSVIYSPLVSFQIPGDFHFFPCFLTLPLHFKLQEEEIYPSLHEAAQESAKGTVLVCDDAMEK